MARVLIIDDELQAREMIGKALAACGHDVREANDGDEGLAMYREEPYDLVITDILMPNKEGLAYIRDLRRIDSRIPIIAISGSTSVVDVLQVARRFGACRTFEKPFDLAHLVEAVRIELEKDHAA